MTQTPDKDSPPDLWSRMETLSRIVAAIAVPLVVGIVGYWVQNSMKSQELDLEYVTIALRILDKEDSSEPMREWAIQLLNDNSPTPLPQELKSGLLSGADQLPEEVSRPAPAPAPRSGPASRWDLNAYYAPLAAADDAAETRIVLHTIIRNHRVIGFNDLWDHLTVTDADPQQEGHVLTVYARASLGASSRLRGVVSDTVWNREHVWPQSRGFSRQGALPLHHAWPAHSDLHNVRPALARLNAHRGAKAFAMAQGPGAVTSGGTITDTVFEPLDDTKGDIARTLFYMDVRYEPADGLDLAVTVDDEPPLPPAVGDSLYRGTIGHLCTLLAWHAQDPPDEGEMRRNDLVYGIQDNRNPFVDRPDLAAVLFGPRCSDTQEPL